jgi:hypothetical protein
MAMGLRRPKFRMLVLGTLGATIVGCGQPGAHGPGTPVPSPTEKLAQGPGVAAQLPAGWFDLSKPEASAAKLNSGVEWVLYLQPSAGGHDYIWILRQPLTAFPSAASSGVASLKDEAIYNFAVEAKTTGCEGPTNQQDNTVDGEAAKLADYVCSSQVERMVVTVHGDSAYLVYFVTDKSTAEENLKALTTVMTSWTWRD